MFFSKQSPDPQRHPRERDLRDRGGLAALIIVVTCRPASLRSAVGDMVRLERLHRVLLHHLGQAARAGSDEAKVRPLLRG
jgi:hypothetical protein